MYFGAELWWVAISNALTPMVVIIFPWRVSSTLTATATHHWLLVTIVADVAGTLGMIPYYLWCRRFVTADWPARFQSKQLLYRLIQQLRRQTGWLLVALNIIPVPDPTVSLIAGAERYPIWRFIAICQIGKLLHILPLTLGTLLFHGQIVALRAWVNQHLYVIWLLVAISLGWWVIRNWQTPPKTKRT